jgi:hypothetical protein
MVIGPRLFQSMRELGYGGSLPCATGDEKCCDAADDSDPPNHVLHAKPLVPEMRREHAT